MKALAHCCDKTRQIVDGVHPMRKAACKQRELMAIIVFNEHVNANWTDEDDFDLISLNSLKHCL